MKDKKKQTADSVDNIIVLNFAEAELPVFKEVKGKDWIQFGEDDLYPDYLLMLADRSAKHNAILGGKVTYIFGNGFKSLSENELLKGWIEKCNNANEGIDDVATKCTTDLETFNGFYLNIIPDRLGRIAEIYHVPFDEIRINEAGSMFYHRADWSKTNWRNKPTPIPRWYKGTTKSSIFFYKGYSKKNRAYPLPNYISGLNWIESDYEVSKQTLSNAKTGFSASKFINFYNGEPENEDAKRKIEKRFNDKFTGSDGKKIVIGFNNDPVKKPTIDDLGNSDLSKEDFTAVDSLITSNIYAGHQITSPMLFGIMEPGKLGNGTELKYAYDIFKSTYANFKQKKIEGVFNFLAGIIFNIKSDLKLQDVDPIGIPFSDQTIVQVAPIGWIWDKLGIDATKYPGQSPAITPTGSGVNPGKNIVTDPANSINPTTELSTNDNLKNLTGRQQQAINRIVRLYESGKMKRSMAVAQLRLGYGLSDEDINAFLGEDGEAFGVQFSEETVAEMFAGFGVDKKDYKIVKSKNATFKENDEEFSYHEVFKAIEGEGTKTSIGRKILDTITGGGNKPPQVSIKYSYEKREDAAGNKVKATTRPFCKKLCTLDRLYSRSEIQSISEQVGYSVWLHSGGFWTHGKSDADPGEREFKCRHEWRSHIVIKK